MVKSQKFLLGGMLTIIGFFLMGCFGGPTYTTYTNYKVPIDQVGVTKIEVNKSTREMKIYSGNRVWKTMRIGLGRNPIGHKTQEGDGKTPEGVYYIDRKNPQSAYHLSLGISYPNKQDVSQARARGVSPGGDIMIHGQPNLGRSTNKRDWTEGCIAVTNREMDLLYRVIPIGTPVIIRS